MIQRRIIDIRLWRPDSELANIALICGFLVFIKDDKCRFLKKDLIHKLSIALKESEECKFWFELIEKKTNIIISENTKDCLDHIQRVIIIIIKSTRS